MIYIYTHYIHGLHITEVFFYTYNNYNLIYNQQSVTYKKDEWIPFVWNNQRIGPGVASRC